MAQNYKAHTRGRTDHSTVTFFFCDREP